MTPARAIEIVRLIARAGAFRSSSCDVFNALQAVRVTTAELSHVRELVPELAGLPEFHNAFGNLNSFERAGVAPELGISLQYIDRLVKKAHDAARERDQS
jgi:hypothetical protein